MQGYCDTEAMNAITSDPRLNALLAAGEPAGGAALDQVAIATGGALVLSAAIAWLGMGHRSGRVPHLGRAADFTERVSGLPGWAALPSACPPPRCWSRCSGCTGTSRSTSTPGATRARSPTPPTT